MARQQTLYQRWFEDWWTTELIAVFLSAGLTAALCAILKTYDGHPLPSFGTWFDSGITLGALVSLLITLSVAASLAAVQACIGQLKWLWYSGGSSRPLGDLDTFDGASRGLTGSLLLLWKLRLSPVASLGALLMIAHLAIAPITQQSVHQVSKPVSSDSDGATAIGGSAWLDSGQQTQTRGMPRGYTLLGSGMMGAITNGLLTDTDVIINITAPHCSSGNCTFPDYQALAVCSSVADVTASVKSSDEGGCILDRFCLTNSQSAVEMLNITSAASSAQANAAADGPLKPLNFSSVAFPDSPATIADFYVLYRDTVVNGTSPTGGTEEYNEYVAVEFMLSWCVQTLSTTVDKTVASITRVPVEKTSFTQKAGSIETDVDGTSFTIDLGTHSTLQRYMWFLLSGHVWQDDDYSDWVDSTEVGVIANQFGVISNGATVNNGTQQDYMNRLAHVLDNLATSMTNYVLSSGDPVTGIVYIQQNFVHVAWGLIAAPVAFTLLCLLFSIGIIFWASFHGGRDRSTPVWKSSLMAGTRSLHPQLHKVLGGMMAQDVMSEKSHELIVHLDREGNEWWLVDAGGEGNGAKEYAALADHNGEIGGADVQGSHDIVEIK